MKKRKKAINLTNDQKQCIKYLKKAEINGKLKPSTQDIISYALQYTFAQSLKCREDNIISLRKAVDIFTYDDLLEDLYNNGIFDRQEKYGVHANFFNEAELEAAYQSHNVRYFSKGDSFFTDEDGLYEEFPPFDLEDNDTLIDMINNSENAVTEMCTLCNETMSNGICKNCDR